MGKRSQQALTVPSGWQQHRDTAEPSQAVTAAGLASPRAVIITHSGLLPASTSSAPASDTFLPWLSSQAISNVVLFLMGP